MLRKIRFYNLVNKTYTPIEIITDNSYLWTLLKIAKSLVDIYGYKDTEISSGTMEYDLVFYDWVFLKDGFEIIGITIDEDLDCADTALNM